MIWISSQKDCCLVLFMHSFTNILGLLHHVWDNWSDYTYAINSNLRNWQGRIGSHVQLCQKPEDIVYSYTTIRDTSRVANRFQHSNTDANKFHIQFFKYPWLYHCWYQTISISLKFCHGTKLSPINECVIMN